VGIMVLRYTTLRAMFFMFFITGIGFGLMFCQFHESLKFESMYKNMDFFPLIRSVETMNISVHVPLRSSARSCETSCNEGCLRMQSIIQRQDEQSTWRQYYDRVVDVANQAKVEKVAEIGIAYGGLTYSMLSGISSLKSYSAVDPFLGAYDSDDIMSSFLAKHNSSDWANAIKYKMRRFGCRFQLFQYKSDFAAHLFNDTSLDMVFIDGDHTYLGCKVDIEQWCPKVRSGGILMFNDYPQFPGVVQAVDSAVKSAKLQLHKLDGNNVYFFVKEHSCSLLSATKGN
jgi:hypothetical protein